MKIILDYDGSSITSPDGFTGAWSGLEQYEFKPEDYGSSAEDVIRLAGLGYTADDIIKMKASGVLK